MRSNRFVCCIFVLTLCIVLPFVHGFSPRTCSVCTRDNMCKPPNCSCCSDHMPIVKTKDTPQMVFFTFDDAVTPSNAKFYRQLFDSRRKNPNGCPIKMTLFVSHENTVYNLVREFYTKGMEIGVHSVSHGHPSSKTFKSEAKKQKENISKMAKVPLSEIKGWRSPFLEPLGDVQPQSLHELDYMYDATLTVSKNSFQNPPIPFTLDYGWPYECKIKPCPKARHRGFWEVPVITLRDYLDKFDCVYVDGCHSPPPDEESAFQFLWNNFIGYYEGNRAPFGINMHASWFFYPDRLKAMDRFITKLGTLDDVYIVTMKQVIAWLKHPTSLANIKMFEPWGCATSTYLLQKRREKLIKEKERQRRIRLMKTHSQMSERHNFWQRQIQNKIQQQQQQRRKIKPKVVNNAKQLQKNPKVALPLNLRKLNRSSRPSINWQRALRYQAARQQKQFKLRQSNRRNFKTNNQDSKMERKLNNKTNRTKISSKSIKSNSFKLPEIRPFNGKEHIIVQKQNANKENSNRKSLEDKAKYRQEILAQDESLTAQYLVEEKSRVGYAADENKKKTTRAKISDLERQLFGSSDIKKKVKSISHQSHHNIKDQPTSGVDSLVRNSHKTAQNNNPETQHKQLPVIKAKNSVSVNKADLKYVKNIVNKSALDKVVNGYQPSINKDAITSERFKGDISKKGGISELPAVAFTSPAFSQNKEETTYLLKEPTVSTSTLPPIYVPSRIRTSTSGDVMPSYDDNVPDTIKWHDYHTTKVSTVSSNSAAENDNHKGYVTVNTLSNRHSEAKTTPQPNKVHRNKVRDRKPADTRSASSNRNILQSLFSLPGLKPLLKELMGYLNRFPGTYLQNKKTQQTTKQSTRGIVPSTKESTTTATESTVTKTESTTTTTESTTTTTTSTTTTTESTTTTAKPTTKTTTIVQGCQQGINCMGPNCLCKSSGPPGGLRRQDVPQLIYFTIEGPVNFLSFSKLRSLFTRQRTNPNGCRISGTLFVPETGTSFGLTNLLTKDGLEIASRGRKHTATRMENFKSDLLRMKTKVEKYTSKSNLGLHGWRNFNLTSLSKNQTRILKNMNMYDSSFVNSGDSPVWPYTLDFGTDKICSDCPNFSGKGVWEIPVTPLELHSRKCLYADSCEPRTSEDTFNFLSDNFKKYSHLNVPFGINLHQNWFRWENHSNLAGLSKFIDTVLKRNNVFIISVSDMLKWIKSPVPKSKISRSIPWKC